MSVCVCLRVCFTCMLSGSAPNPGQTFQQAFYWHQYLLTKRSGEEEQEDEEGETDEGMRP